MKFTKYTFLMLGLASLFSLCDSDAVAELCKNKDVSAGKYCKAGGSGTERSCPQGCYCLGAKRVEGLDWGDTRIDNDCANHDRANGEINWSNVQRVGIRPCPSGYEESDAGAKSEDECYYKHQNGQWSNKVYHKKIKCDPGKYLKAYENSCRDCLSGYYCPGVGETYPVTSDTGLKTCPSGQIPNSGKTGCENKPVYCDTGTYLPANSSTCAPCPNDKYCVGGNFTPGSSSQGAYSCEAGKVPNSTHTGCLIDTSTKVTCKKGEYLPQNSSSCVSCTGKIICTGGTFNISTTQDQGKGAQCGIGDTAEEPDNDKGVCVIPTVQCATKTYLPKNSGTCAACPNNKFCPGGTFEIMRNFDQGVNESAGITVAKGYYLPKGTGTPKGCTGTSRYCPGGTFDVSTIEDQGIYNCPANSRTTEDKSACAITLTKKQMMYGINGTGGRYSENALQCWSKNGDDYKACMGFKTDGTWTAPQSSGSTAGSGKNFYIKFEEKMPAVSIGSKVNLFMGGAQK